MAGISLPGIPHPGGTDVGLANAATAAVRGLSEDRNSRARLDALIENDRAQRALQARQLDQADAARYVNPADIVPFLPPELRGDFPTGSGRVPAHVFEKTFPLWQQQSELRRQGQQADEGAQAIREAGKVTTEGPIPEGKYGPGSPVTSVSPRAEFLAKMFGQSVKNPATSKFIDDYLKPKPFTAAPGASVYQQDPLTGETKMIAGGQPPAEPGTPEEETSLDPDTGRRTKTVLDSLTGRQRRTVDQAPPGELYTSHYNRIQALDRAAKTRPLTPEEQTQRQTSVRAMDDLRPLIMPPGSAQFPRMPEPGTQPAPAAGAPPGALRSVPPLTTEGEAEKVGLRNSIITQLEHAADVGEKMPQLQEAGGRASLRVRSYVQGHTPFETLSNEEQRWVTTHDRLRIMYEASTMGLGPFRSPEMQSQLAEIIGKYWTPGTSERLRTLADNLRAESAGVQGAQAAGGRRVLPAPAPRPDAAPGGGAPSPVVRWGRDANGRPVRLP